MAKAISVVANPDEPADLSGGGGLAEWAMLTVHALRIELGKSYRVAMDLLSEMPGVLDEIALTKLSHYTVLRTWFERISTKTRPVRFSVDEQRNAPVTLLSIRLALTVNSLAATTLTE